MQPTKSNVGAFLIVKRKLETKIVSQFLFKVFPFTLILLPFYFNECKVSMENTKTILCFKYRQDRIVRAHLFESYFSMIYNMYYKYNYIFLSCRFYRLYIEQKKLSFCNFYDHYIYRSYKKFLSWLLLLTSLPQATNDCLKLHSPNEGPLNVHYIYSKYTLFQITSIW